MRSLTASAAASTSAAAGPRQADSLSAAAVAGLWLPQHSWDPLASSVGGPPGHQPGWQVLLPQQSAAAGQKQQQGQGVHAQRQPSAGRPLASVGASHANVIEGGGGGNLPCAGAPAVLTYSQVSEVVSYSRQLQKLQQLLLQFAVESVAVPRLLELLLQCCQGLHLQAAPAGVAAPSAAGTSVTHDRCCALYRLLYALAAGPVSKRGLGAACQLAVVEQEAPEDYL